MQKKKKSSNSKPITTGYYLIPELREWVLGEAKRLDRSASWVIASLIRQAMEAKQP